ncbi:MAG TPA: RDD family protein, partial [Pirellulales bacterium]|nr:RDD family protein [Pirellulales bacterium]
MSSASAQLDTRIEIVTPENIAFQYRIAGPFRRLPAYLIDVLLRTSILFAAVFAISLATSFIGQAGLGFGMIMVGWFALDWFYGGLFEAYWNGQTPGKRLMRIRVVSDEGQPINGVQAVLRNFLRSVDAMPVAVIPIAILRVQFQIAIPTYLVGLLSTSMNNRFQRLGDLAAGTMVIIEEPQRHYGVARVSEPEAIRLAADLPANLAISRSLARALSSYVQRRQAFPWRRRAEIAMHVAEPMRVRLGLPPGTSHDLLLCALYHRAFIADRVNETAASPFAAN